jgi:hypothetical protein
MQAGVLISFFSPFMPPFSHLLYFHLLYFNGLLKV